MQVKAGFAQNKDCIDEKEIKHVAFRTEQGSLFPHCTQSLTQAKLS